MRADRHWTQGGGQNAAGSQPASDIARCYALGRFRTAISFDTPLSNSP